MVQQQKVRLDDDQVEKINKALKGVSEAINDFTRNFTAAMDKLAEASTPAEPVNPILASMMESEESDGSA